MTGARPAPLERRPSPNRSLGRAGRSPLGVVIHTTQAPLDAAVGWMTDPASAVSAHYAVGLDGSVFQLVDEQDAAHHAGRVREPTAALVSGEGADPNLYTVGIELADDGDPNGVERPDEQYAAAARLVAEICSRWAIPVDSEHVLGHREIFSAKDCPGNVDLERLVAMAARRPPGATAAAGQSIACLTPIRNEAADLPGMLSSAAGFADCVIALDDGSTDATGELLAGTPLVARVLANPPRATYAGWDDAANRRRLLAAAHELGMDWVVFLDADERIDPGDGAALRDFLLADALPGLAYGLRLYREWGTEVGVEPVLVYRAFHARTSGDLAAKRLHLIPVPQSLSAARLVRTTIRVRHLDSPERLVARRGKYSEADPEGAFADGAGPLLEPPGGPVAPWRPRPASLPVLDIGDGAGLEPVLGHRPRLACLLPVRNGAAEIEGYLDGLEGLADLVIALDDGSTDETVELLEASPQVARVLRNPRRETYAGWDDAANRQALLDGAVELGADWVLFLDADERIDAADSAALRRFVDMEADPGCAYGMRVHRMIGDVSHFDASGLWAFRLFAAQPGARLPKGRLHALPVPEAIPPERRIPTTVRIQHLASLTPELRRARVAKYSQADPGLRWQSGYAALARDPEELQEWHERAVDLPVVAGDVGALAGELDGPVLSAIVIARDDVATIAASVGSVVGQRCREPFEVIVVVSGSARTAAVVRDRFPDVRLVELAEPVLPGAARNAGLAQAGGEYVSFPGSHTELRAGSLAARIAAHDRGYAMVTGSILNGTTTRSGWASYFIDHSSALPGRPAGELAGAPAHCSYRRDALAQVGGFPEDLRAGEDTVVNQELFRRGHTALREPSIELVHRSRCTGPLRLVAHHFERGRAMARIQLAAGGSRRALARFLLGYSRRRVADTDARVARWGAELRSEYRRSRPLVIAGVMAALCGAVAEAFAGRRRRAGA